MKFTLFSIGIDAISLADKKIFDWIIVYPLERTFHVLLLENWEHIEKIIHNLQDLKWYPNCDRQTDPHRTISGSTTKTVGIRLNGNVFPHAWCLKFFVLSSTSLWKREKQICKKNWIFETVNVIRWTEMYVPN